jgi:hypothetical protein
VSTWIIFAVCFTAVLLGAGSAFTLLAFYRAGRKMKEADSRGGEAGRRGVRK